jgi:hypothetical protein
LKIDGGTDIEVLRPHLRPVVQLVCRWFRLCPR